MERAGCSVQRAGTSQAYPPAVPLVAGAAVAARLIENTQAAPAQRPAVLIVVSPSCRKVAPVSWPRHSSKQLAPMLIRLAALALLLIALWRVFRLAMGLRFAKVSREEARAAEEGSGRMVVAELPLSDAEVVFLVEDADAFRWGRAHVTKRDIGGARLMVNGAVLQEFRAPGESLPAPEPPEEYEGRERWEVRVFRRGGGATAIPCGTLREGISREIAGRVFAAVQEGCSRGPDSP